jgi:hypothetical protein
MRIIHIEEIKSSKPLNKPKKITLSDNTEWILKLSKDEHKSKWRYTFRDLYKREKVSYIISEKLNWCLVPETKIVSIDNNIASIQKWINGDKADPTLKSYSKDSIFKAGLFDLVTGQSDRTKNNWLSNGKNISLIDNGESFPEKANNNDWKSVIISRFAFKIFNEKIPIEYIQALNQLDSKDLNKKIMNLVGKDSFILYLERLNYLITTQVASFPKYKIVKRLKDIEDKIKGG